METIADYIKLLDEAIEIYDEIAESNEQDKDMDTYEYYTKDKENIIRIKTELEKLETRSMIESLVFNIKCKFDVVKFIREQDVELLNYSMSLIKDRKQDKLRRLQLEIDKVDKFII